jgi:RNA polymerase sigma-70 factor (ECF subfamily)
MPAMVQDARVFAADEGRGSKVTMRGDASVARSRVTASGDIAEALGAMRGELLRFAHMQLRDRDGAEDAVQDAMLAAVAGAARFDGRSSLKTWVFGILRNKIVDRLRALTRSVGVGSLAADGDDTAAWERLFDEREHWAQGAAPVRWQDPEAALGSSEFYAVFETCMERLPATTARAFAMREVLGLETAEICDRLSITSGNFHVLMHRARLCLRECIDERWFRLGGGPC